MYACMAPLSAVSNNFSHVGLTTYICIPTTPWSSILTVQLSIGTGDILTTQRTCFSPDNLTPTHLHFVIPIGQNECFLEDRISQKKTTTRF